MGAGGESPHHVRPQSHFPMPTSDHQSLQCTKYRHFSSIGMRHSQRGRERAKEEEISKTRSTLTTLTSPLCSPGTARALHEVRYRKAEPELHISISISSATVLLFVSGLAHTSTHIPTVSTFRCC